MHDMPDKEQRHFLFLLNRKNAFPANDKNQIPHLMSDARCHMAHSRRALGHHASVQLQASQSTTCPYASDWRATFIAFMVRIMLSPTFLDLKRPHVLPLNDKPLYLPGIATGIISFIFDVEDLPWMYSLPRLS
jgi:hypothetical protein